ncbi:DUF6333 family protein [Streptomyces sp. NPDC046182]|uniref:DUF6333 family protein n=1 Tax=Streptomyces sp. NPDC046182 TaxID=3154601 RepID=UPI003401D966
MTDDSIWDSAPDASMLRDGTYSLTVIDNPSPHALEALPPHDPARAREVVASLAAVAGVAEELDPQHAATELVPQDTRADLELVRVGCWGPVTEITDAALAFRDGFFPLDDQAAALAERFPGAAVIGSARINFPVRYGAWVLLHPGGARLWAEGWSGEDPWNVQGSVEDILDAFQARTALDPDFDFDAEPRTMDFTEVEDAVLRTLMPVDRRGRVLSVFRVARTPEAAARLEETWMEE